MLPVKFAIRYLFSRKSHAAVNIICAVAMATVTVAAAAMVIVMSVFNGFASLVITKTSGFNPDLLITTTDGTPIQNADSLIATLDDPPLSSSLYLPLPLHHAYPIIDGQAIAISGDRQIPVRFRALDTRNLVNTPFRRHIIDGDNPFSDSASILSVGVAMELQCRPGDTLTIISPRRQGRINPGNPLKSFRRRSIAATAVFQIEQDEQDRDMLILPLHVARTLLDYPTQATAIAIEDKIYLTHNTWEARFNGHSSLKKALTERLGPGYSVLDQRQQQAEAFRMIAVEKWITFLMLLLILAVSSFNIISTMSLMVVEKAPNLATLRALGAPPSLLRRIFACLGILITLGGGCAGIILGTLLTIGQQTWGWVKLTPANPAMMAIDHYPVSLHPSDLLQVLLSLAAVALLVASFAPLLTKPSKR